MHMAEPEIPSSRPKVRLGGQKEVVKPLEHSAKKLSELLPRLSHPQTDSQAAEALAQIKEVMRDSKWAGAHDTAHAALQAAEALVKKNPSKELEEHAISIGMIASDRAPTLEKVQKVAEKITHEGLKGELKKLVEYLTKFEKFVGDWAGLSLSPATPKETEAPTSEGYTRYTHNAACDDACTVDHTPSNTVSNATHIHGPDCGHSLPATPVQAKRLNNLLLVAGAAVVVGIGTYVFHARKRAQQQTLPQPTDKNWQERAQQEAQATAEVRTL